MANSDYADLLIHAMWRTHGRETELTLFTAVLGLQIEAEFTTEAGEKRKSLLLASGW